MERSITSLPALNTRTISPSTHLRAGPLRQVTTKYRNITHFLHVNEQYSAAC